jgi:hypothetical protein
MRIERLKDLVLSHSTRVLLSVSSACFAALLTVFILVILGPTVLPSTFGSWSDAENAIVIGAPLVMLLSGIGGFAACWNLTKRLER